jgi:hypothetical protein
LLRFTKSIRCSEESSSEELNGKPVRCDFCSYAGAAPATVSESFSGGSKPLRDDTWEGDPHKATLASPETGLMLPDGVAVGDTDGGSVSPLFRIRSLRTLKA